jgi:hypothetical protein
LPFALIAWLRAPERLRDLAVPFVLLFFVGNLVSFTPNPYDNSKIFAYVQLGGSIVLGGYLAGWLRSGPFRLLPAALVVLLCFSGVLAIGFEVRNHTLVISHEEAAAVVYIKKNTAPDDIFLTSSSLTDPVPAFTGRRIVMGSKEWLFSHGIPYEERARDVKEIFRGGPNAPELLVKYDVTWVLVGPRERAEFPDLDEEFFKAIADESIAIGTQTLYRLRGED